jgi:hypothetical protein
VRLSARKGILRIYGKGEQVREVPIHPELRKESIASMAAAPDASTIVAGTSAVHLLRLVSADAECAGS